MDHALSLLAETRTAAEIGNILREAVAELGYDNVALARTIDGSLSELPWLWFPDGFAETYIISRWEETDPVLKRACQSRLPFAWSQMLATTRLTHAQRRFMDGAKAWGLHHGLCIPFHGAGNQVDIVSISTRNSKDQPDPSQHRTVSMLALMCLVRYLELTEELKPAAGKPVRRINQCSPGSSSAINDLLSKQYESPFVLPTRHLRALLLVEAGERRWKLGLTKLASDIYLLRNAKPYCDLERWGMIVDVPDDERWRYYLAPSVLGQSYLRRSAEAEFVRGEIWSHDIDHNEVPDCIEAE